MSRRYSKVVADFVIPMVVIVAILAVVFFAVSCSKPPAQGIITERRYQAAHMEGAFRTRYGGQECRTVSRYDGKRYVTSQECTPKYDTYYEPNDHWVPEAWQFNLKDCKTPDDCNEGWVTVSSDTYEKYQVGQHYPDPR